MQINLKRFAKDEKGKLGFIHVDGQPFCFSLEPLDSIHTGIYLIKFRKVDSPMTLKYRDKYPWFTYHIELQNVHGAKYVYIHIGNDFEDTRKCVLVGESATLERSTHDRIGSSLNAYRPLYELISEKLENNETVKLVVE